MNIKLFWHNTRKYRCVFITPMLGMLFFAIAACHTVPTQQYVAKPPVCEITGIHWQLVEIYGKKAEHYADQPDAHLVFSVLDKQSEQEVVNAAIAADLPVGKALRLSGSDGCNRLLGIVMLLDNNARFDNVGTTMMMCPRGGEQARALARAFHDVTSLRQENGQLELLQHGQRIALFTRRTLNPDS